MGNLSNLLLLLISQAVGGSTPPPIPIPPKIGCTIQYRPGPYEENWWHVRGWTLDTEGFKRQTSVLAVRKKLDQATKDCQSWLEKQAKKAAQ